MSQPIVHSGLKMRSYRGCIRSLSLALGLLSLQPIASPSAQAAPTAATAPSADELMRRIDLSQQNLRSLSAEFVQHTHVKLFKQQVQSQGRMLYDRGSPAPALQPGSTAGSPASTRLRWEYLRPDASTMLILGDKATLRIGTRAPQVFDTARDPTMRVIFTQLQLWLGNGSLQSAKAEYEVQSGGTSDQPALLLSPRAGTVLSKVFARIELHVDGKTLQLNRLLLVENSGDEKEILFSHVQRNVPIPAAMFQ
jgi:outer membrane lipoprotein-sorting protein